MLEVPAGLEPTMTELQSVALPTWLWNRLFFLSFSVARLVYNIFEVYAIVFLHFFTYCFSVLKKILKKWTFFLRYFFKKYYKL